MSDELVKAILVDARQDLADIAQDRLCRAGVNHAWGPWVRTAHYEAPPTLGPVSAGDVVPDSFLTVTSERRCANCGATDSG